MVIANVKSRVEKRDKAKASASLTKKNQKPKGPPGKIKLANALRQLLERKDFNSITTAEIAITAGTNEALIYRYFGDKRGLLHQILAEYMEEFKKDTLSSSKGHLTPAENLRQLISNCLLYYSTNRVFARIIFVESRNCVGFFQSETYDLIKDFARFVLEIIERGVESGEIRKDIPPRFIRDLILGAIEHFVLPAILLGKEINPEEHSRILCDIVFKGIITPN